MVAGELRKKRGTTHIVDKQINISVCWSRRGGHNGVERYPPSAGQACHRFDGCFCVDGKLVSAAIISAKTERATGPRDRNVTYNYARFVTTDTGIGVST